jgi:hypothetical protein
LLDFVGDNTDLVVPAYNCTLLLLDYYEEALIWLESLLGDSYIARYLVDNMDLVELKLPDFSPISIK